MPFADYHVHTPLCRHAQGSPAEYVQAAIAANLDEIGFSDHVPLPGGFDADQRMLLAELPDYVAAVEELGGQFPEIKVRLGLEADFRPGMEEAVAAVLAAHPWDFVLGSVHHIGEWGFDNPRFRDEWDRREIVAVWREYYALVARAAASGLCDVLAHFDLPKVFGHRPGPAALEVELARPALEAVARHGLALEVSTGGLRKPCAEIYPAEAVLREAFALGIPVTLGSDAHQPADVAFGLAQAVALLRRVGYRSYLVYSRRKAHEAALL